MNDLFQNMNAIDEMVKIFIRGSKWDNEKDYSRILARMVLYYHTTGVCPKSYDLVRAIRSERAK